MPLITSSTCSPVCISVLIGERIKNSEPGDLGKYRTLYKQSESVPAVFRAKEIPKGISEQEHIYKNYVVKRDFSRELNSDMLDLYDQVLLTYLRSLADKDIHTDTIDIASFSKREEKAPAHLDRINGRSSRTYELHLNESKLHLEGWGLIQLVNLLAA
ncbi:MAG: hypothetical protein HKN87_06495 [Saprospiraceae bacterium]|nr:hypothetical protein [Saprospiraceae bacterium]